MKDEEYTDLVPVTEYHVHRICTPSWEIKEMIIPFIDLTYVLKGSAEYEIGGKTYILTAGDLLCIPRGTLRRAVGIPSDLMECYPTNFYLYNHYGEEIDLPFPLITKIGHRPDLITMYRHLNEEWLRRVPGYQLKVHGHLLMILQRLFEIIIYKTDLGLMDNRIKKSIRHITEHYARPLNIQELSELTGLNPVYFGSLFKQCTGMTFREYLTSIRLNHAEDMLRSGEYNVNEVALLCGFTDIFYFSKVFKRSRGVPPSRVYKTG